MNTVQHTCARRRLRLHSYFLNQRSTIYGNGNDRESTYQRVITVDPFDSHDPCITLIGKYLVKYSHERSTASTIFYAFWRRSEIADQGSIARLICRAFDQQLESCVGKYTGRLQVRCCSYLLAFTSLSFFLFLPLISPALFLLSLSPARFSFVPSFPRRGALEFTKLTREINHPAYLRR